MRLEHHRAWVQHAERDVIACCMCKCHAGLDETTTLWRNGLLIFALCDRRATAHDVVFSTTEAGVEVRAKRRDTLVVGGGT